MHLSLHLCIFQLHNFNTQMTTFQLHYVCPQDWLDSQALEDALEAAAEEDAAGAATLDNSTRAAEPPN